MFNKAAKARSISKMSWSFKGWTSLLTCLSQIWAKPQLMAWLQKDEEVWANGPQSMEDMNVFLAKALPGPYFHNHKTKGRITASEGRITCREVTCRHNRKSESTGQRDDHVVRHPCQCKVILARSDGGKWTDIKGSLLHRNEGGNHQDWPVRFQLTLSDCGAFSTPPSLSVTLPATSSIPDFWLEAMLEQWGETVGPTSRPIGHNSLAAQLLALCMSVPAVKLHSLVCRVVQRGGIR